MENGDGTNGKRIRAEDVICKLKDDGDFDRLRLKIVRRMKENVELRNSLRAAVKESAALNRPGAENMKLRQLSDAIYQEVGDNLDASDDINRDLDTELELLTRMNGFVFPKFLGVDAVDWTKEN